MIKTSSTTWSGCPIRFAMGLFGDKWSLLLIRDLMFKGKRHYGEFTDPEEQISTNILADRLKKLEQGGLISKQRDPDNQTRYIYGLTERGLDLIPVMLSLIDWSQRHDPDTEVPEAFIAELRQDAAAFAGRIRAGLTGDAELVIAGSGD